ncbi:MAG: hypothetical protein SFW35_00785 [Chitinophagales bacterium]|nr:hypothetical protein [Chitinophagales bacterium]
MQAGTHKGNGWYGAELMVCFCQAVLKIVFFFSSDEVLENGQYI